MLSIKKKNFKLCYISYRPFSPYLSSNPGLAFAPSNSVSVRTTTLRPSPDYRVGRDRGGGRSRIQLPRAIRSGAGPGAGGVLMA